jgi:O-antigen/teichoic acid export membrane protein
LGIASGAGTMSQGEVVHRALRVSMASGISMILSVTFQLVSVPVCLAYWGGHSYGVWLALFSGFMLLRSLDGGYVNYVGNKINYLYHEDVGALRSHLASAKFGIAFICIIQLFLTVCAAVFDSFASIFGTSASGGVESADRFGLLVLVISWVLTGSYLGIVHRLLIPSGLMYEAAWWGMTLQVGQFAVIMLAAFLGLGLLTTSILFAASQAATYIASALYIRHRLPQFSPWLQGGTIGMALRDLGQSAMLTASSFIQLGSSSGIVLLISGFAGPAAVPVFTTVRTLSNLWINLTNILTAPLLPDVVRYHARGEVQKLRAMNQVFWVLVVTVVNLTVIFLFPLIPLFYSKWTAHVVAFDNNLFCLLLGGVVLANAGASMMMHLIGINSLKFLLSTSLVRASWGLGIGLVLYNWIGLAGFGVGIFLGEFFALVITVWYFSSRQLSKKGAPMPVRSIHAVMVSVGSVLFFLLDSAFLWLPVGFGLLFALFGVGVGFYFGWRELDTDVRGRLLSAFRMKFRRA